MSPKHQHHFDQHIAKGGEPRTRWVVAMTGVTMVIEICAGMIFGSMALLAAKYLGVDWMDPVMGIVGGALVARWSWGLLRQTSRVLLDRQAPENTLDAIRSAIEGDGRLVVTDLHVWEIGPGYRAAAIAVSARQPVAPGDVKDRLPAAARIEHATVEVDWERR